MDFGSILDEWEAAARRGPKPQRPDQAGRESAVPAAAENPAAGAVRPARLLKSAEPARVDPLTAWLRVHGVDDKDAAGAADAPRDDDHQARAEVRRAMRARRPDITVDLHGMTQDEAWHRLNLTFAEAARWSWRKVLVVHGKGHHSDGEAVLKRVVRQFVEGCPIAGEHGQADPSSGGAGATWVIIRRKGEK
jgi:DNA-nicking Smr family endonuclease